MSRQNPPQDPDPLMKPADAAAYLGLSVDYLEKKRATGGGPEFVAISRKAVRYRKSALDRFVAGRTVANTTEARRVLDDLAEGDRSPDGAA